MARRSGAGDILAPEVVRSASAIARACGWFPGRCACRIRTDSPGTPPRRSRRPFTTRNMTVFAYCCLVIGVGLAGYAYAGYPALLLVIGRRARRARAQAPLREVPLVTVTVPAHNEEATIAATLDSLLRLDYPCHLLEILVVSDASTDRTDEIVRRYADRGVKLLRLPERRGKTAAENAARRAASGEIVVNTDASVRVPPHALEPLIAAFADAAVAVASGRDISVAPREDGTNAVEGGYVGYEMWVRSPETRAGGIIGTSGCFFASRAGVLESDLPESLSWDFAAALIARERGYRAVSVPEAVCHVPRTSSLRQEYRRKVRTLARGMQTLRYKRGLLNPVRYRGFAWMLFSHKVCRWLVPWAALAAWAALGWIGIAELWARYAFLAGTAVAFVGAAGWWWPLQRSMPRLVSLCAFLLAGNVAVVHATLRALGGAGTPSWEPTRRAGIGVAPATET
jgi:cellulose synthase/poly-beta-1,6-N-acetylglucosamine synthase-like glycosyltransferase